MVKKIEDLRDLFKKETGQSYERFPESYYKWVEERLIEKFEREEELNNYLHEDIHRN